MSKDLFHLVVPHLYRNVRLPYHPEDSQWARVVTLAQSQYLRLVRSIEIGHHYTGMTRLCRQLHQLFHNLPSNSLTRFNFGSHGRPEASDQVHLWKTQSTLQDLQLNFWVNSPSLQDLVRDEQATLRSLQCLTTIRMNLVTEADPDLIVRLLSLFNTANLREVEVVYMLIRHDATPSAGVAHLVNWLPIYLTQLSLGQVTFPDQTRFHLSQFHSIRRLQLIGCSNIASVLNGAHTPTLQGFLIQCNVGHMASEFNAYVGFIAQATNLKTLIIDNKLSNVRLDSLATAISSHAKAMRVLMVDCHRDATRFLPSWLKKFDCSQLRQLALRSALLSDADSSVAICKVCISRCPDSRLNSLTEVEHCHRFTEAGALQCLSLSIERGRATAMDEWVCVQGIDARHG